MNSRERNRLLLVAEGYFRSGSQHLAKLVLEDLMATDGSSSRAHELLGYIYGNEGRLPEAHQSLERACQLPKASPEAFYYLGVSFMKRGLPRQAINAFDKSLALGGLFFEALHDRGTAHSLLGENDKAMQDYVKAQRLNPNSFDLIFNIGKLCDKTKDFGKALIYYERALELNPGVADVWAHKGAVLYDAKRYVEAIDNWERALSIDPGIDFLPGFRLHASLRLCDWRRWEFERDELLRRVENDENACGPFEILAISGEERLQLKCSRRWVAAYFPGSAVVEPARQSSQGKIRIGYFSADFGRHAVSYLTAELYELHDRGAFEVFGFALNKAAQDDEMRARLVGTFDHFVEVSDKSDNEVVELARGLGIDIAVDLGGHTKGSRTGLFRDRVAPVQVNFLGYPGTVGANFMDYMIADLTVIPEGSREYYTERIVYLPDCFQPSDAKRSLPESQLPRSAFALPDDGFVFCCFNNSYKITPELFNIWMKILASVEGSCLWILADVEQDEANLRGAAERLGIAADRLVFGGRLPMAEYLDRYCKADLFLDTLPFNGGTTVNDALWAGLPVLTRPGNSFAGRMAASLLKTLELPELIASTAEEYESRAVRLAQRPTELAQIKERLRLNRDTGPLFNMPVYTRTLELAFREMHRRSRAGLPPDHIHVARPD